MTSLRHDQPVDGCVGFARGYHLSGKNKSQPGLFGCSLSLYDFDDRLGNDREFGKFLNF